jgi:hypothetical protein
MAVAPCTREPELEGKYSGKEFYMENAESTGSRENVTRADGFLGYAG